MRFVRHRLAALPTKAHEVAKVPNLRILSHRFCELSFTLVRCSDGIAKVGVEGSNPFARSNLRSFGASVGKPVFAREGCPP